MKGKLKYYYKCEETPNSIEGWSVSPIRDEMTCISFHLNDKSIEMLKDFDKSKTYDIDYELFTNCRINEDGFHSHHGVIAELKSVETKFGTYTMETKNSTKISTDKLDVFVKRLKKIGIDIKLSGNFPWVYINEICGIRVTEKFEANHGFTVMFLPGRNDSPPSEFTDITEIFKLIRKYVRQAKLVDIMKMDEKDGLYETE